MSVRGKREVGLQGKLTEVVKIWTILRVSPAALGEGGWEGGGLRIKEVPPFLCEDQLTALQPCL